MIPEVLKTIPGHGVSRVEKIGILSILGHDDWEKIGFVIIIRIERKHKVILT